MSAAFWRVAPPLSLMACLLACIGAASAAPAAPTAAPDPLDAKAKVPALQHRSALRAYRSAHEVPPVGWRDANDTVGRVGGWRSYAREAAAPEPAASAGSGPSPHDGHAGHKPK